MKIGVVSDTHNNLYSVKKIINIFNEECVDYVIHTGDITNIKTLESFSSLKADLFGVFGNNDRIEPGLVEKAIELGFTFSEPPLQITLRKKIIAIFHEPESIEKYIDENQHIDLVLHGHTHRFREENYRNTIIFNPGESAGFIKGGNAIGIVELDSITTRRIFF
tara:strand:+ start:1982 stop:2473 length:492 start_codon:yes stop_codon:yes gene_type:complete